MIMIGRRPADSLFVAHFHHFVSASHVLGYGRRFDDFKNQGPEEMTAGSRARTLSNR
jgi:hypothetical protein